MVVYCQTTPSPQSQLDAAHWGMRQIVLDQIAPVSDEWFENPAQRAMFRRRLATLKNEA